MKAKILYFLSVLAMIINIIPSAFFTVGANDAATEVENILSSMSLRDKVTQMMMVDFRKWGDTADEAASFTEMNDEVRKILEDYKFGAVILFSNNLRDTEQTFRLTQSLQEATTKNGGLPLIITTDQEGGIVARLGSGTSLPGNMALGATYAANGTKYAKESGRIMGSELSALGINANLAPVVDVNVNANNPVIGLRSFGDDPEMVGELACAIIRGMAEYNVIGTAKHFPGHGDTADDSHYDLPILEKDLEEMKQTELKPYEMAIAEGIEMIMTAHILYPALESDKVLSKKTGELESLPATMSDDILTGLLKEEMGFGGIIITDAMNMEGIVEKWDPVQAAVLSVKAGVDMICMPTRLYCTDDLAVLDDIIEGIVNAVSDGEIPSSRIDDAVRRILTVKNNRGVLDYDPDGLSLEHALSTVGCDANREMEREMATAAITLVKNENETLPLKLTETSKVLMLAVYDDERASMIMAWNRAKQAGIIPEGAQVDFFKLSEDSLADGEFAPELKSKLDVADTLVILSECSSAAHMKYERWITAIPDQLCDFARENQKKSVIISADKPYDVQLYPNSDAIVAAYGWKGSSVDPTEALIGGITGSEASYGPNIIAAVEVILGKFSPKGKLPLDIPVFDPESSAYTSAVAFERGYGLTYPPTEEDGPDATDLPTDVADDTEGHTEGATATQALLPSASDGLPTGVIIAISVGAVAVVCAAAVAAIIITKAKRRNR